MAEDGAHVLHDVEPMTVDELFDGWERAWSGRDAAAFDPLCDDDVHYEDPLTPEPIEGAAAIAKHAGRLWTAFPDARMQRTGERTVNGPYVAAEVLRKAASRRVSPAGRVAMSMTRVWLAAGFSGLVAMILAAAAPAAAQNYPARPVKLVVPYPPGGPNDIMARILAQKLTEALGGQFYVENVVGAGGTIATGQVANAPAEIVSTATARACRHDNCPRCCAIRQ